MSMSECKCSTAGNSVNLWSSNSFVLTERTGGCFLTLVKGSVRPVLEVCL